MIKKIFLMPPFIFIISILLIFLIYKYLNFILIPKIFIIFILAILLLIVGLLFIISAFLSFNKYKTEIHPFKKPKFLSEVF